MNEACFDSSSMVLTISPSLPCLWQVIDSLLDVVMSYTVQPSTPPAAKAPEAAAAAGTTAMDVDVAAPPAAGAAAGQAAASPEAAAAEVEASEVAAGEEVALSPLKVVQQLVAMSPGRAKQILVLSMLAQYCKVGGGFWEGLGWGWV